MQRTTIPEMERRKFIISVKMFFFGPLFKNCKKLYSVQEHEKKKKTVFLNNQTLSIKTLLSSVIICILFQKDSDPGLGPGYSCLLRIDPNGHILYWTPAFNASKKKVYWVWKLLWQPLMTAFTGYCFIFWV